MLVMGFPHGSDGKASACNAGDQGLIPGLGRYPGEGNSNPLQYSCLENPMDRGDWQVKVHRVTKSQTQLSNFTSMLVITLADIMGLGRLSVQFSSVTQSCPTLRDPMNRSMPGLPVHHQLPEFTQIHVHQVSDAIQPSHPLL